MGNLKATSIDSVKSNDFFTRNTDQTISSIIHFKKASVIGNFNCSELNGIDLQNDIIYAKPGATVVVNGIHASTFMFINLCVLR